MRLLMAALLLSATAAHAGPRKFSMTWDEHGPGKKGFKTVKSTYVVDGTKLHYETTYDGPEPDKPRNKPRKLDVVIKNEADVDKWFAALDKIPATPTKALDPKKLGSTACITIGTKKRCETFEEDAKSPGYKSIEELTIALLDNVPSVE